MDQQAVAQRHPAEPQARARAVAGHRRVGRLRRRARAHVITVRARPDINPARAEPRAHRPARQVEVEARRQLEVGDRDALVGAVDQRRQLARASSRCGARSRRRSRPNALRNQWLSLKPGITIGTGAGAGVDLGHPRGDRVGERRLESASGCRRRTPANSISHVAVAEQLGRPARGRGPRQRSGGTAAVDEHLGSGPGSRCPSPPPATMVGRQRDSEHRLGEVVGEQRAARERTRSTRRGQLVRARVAEVLAEQRWRGSSTGLASVGSSGGCGAEAARAAAPASAARCPRSAASTRGRRARGCGAGTGRRPSRRAQTV